MNRIELPLMKKVKDLEVALASSVIAVGWIDGNGSQQVAYANLMTRKQTGERTGRVGKPASLALIAATLNFGREEGSTLEGRKYPAIPARPFVDFAKQIWSEVFPKVIKKNLPMYLNGIMSLDSFLIAIGERAKESMQKAIREGHYAPLSPRTIAAKGSSTPLIDTGRMVNSVSFEIRRG